jgi:hypothetical protein
VAAHRPFSFITERSNALRWRGGIRAEFFFLATVPIPQGRYAITKIFFAAERSRGNQKTPERMTIENPLYFCSRQFVGQFAPVIWVAVGSGSLARWLMPVSCAA